MKKYMDIERLKAKNLGGFEVGDLIYIEEKVDGANYSIKYDGETDTIKSFSRRMELTETNTLRGGYVFSQTLNKELLKEVLGDDLIIFGEWLVAHAVPYPQERYQKAYFYDVYNTKTGTYLPQNESIEIVNKLNLTYVPIFYIEKFISWEHVMSFIGKTELGGEYGEGVVVKNMTKLNNPNTRNPFYVKLVGEKFCETKAHKGLKTIDPEALAERERIVSLTESIVTKARVSKLIYKFVDEGLIAEDWDEKDMGTIAKNMGRSVYADCVKEESETVELIGKEFGKFANSTAMKYVKEILKEL